MGMASCQRLRGLPAISEHLSPRTRQHTSAGLAVVKGLFGRKRKRSDELRSHITEGPRSPDHRVARLVTSNPDAARRILSDRLGCSWRAPVVAMSFEATFRKIAARARKKAEDRKSVRQFIEKFATSEKDDQVTRSHRGTTPKRRDATGLWKRRYGG